MVQVAMASAEISMLQKLIQSNGIKTMLEIGFWKGGSAVRWLQVLREGKLASIDPTPEPDPTIPWESIANFRLVRGVADKNSLTAIELFFEQPIDLCFIDGMHTEEQVLSDIHAVWSYMANHSWIAFHDMFYPPVSRAICRGYNEFKKQIAFHYAGSLSMNTDINGPYAGLYFWKVRKNIPLA